eukprot:CAMPEP_0172464538 /NCGR_PEP_ID=MMETSP1065-20121228/50762_1 /TAXON_ID=265537 /ORGANISM="Amphiprora paludosa, Strain CCMP125" /LENGTH=48 /DNA_ID= /DNA_START= /DNA_END= /DNA_ORIENTATION=
MALASNKMVAPAKAPPATFIKLKVVFKAAVPVRVKNRALREKFSISDE